MVLKIYGSARSTCTQRVMAVLYEKKVPFEIIEVDVMGGAHKAPGFMLHQPFGQIPYIDDDGFILYESRAICRYIAAKYPNQGTALLPTDLKANALFEQAASIESSNFDPHASSAVFEGVFKKILKLTFDAEAFKTIVEKLDAKLDAYEVILGKQKYLAGDEITLADLFHLPYGSLLAAAGTDVMSRKPNVSRWFKELQGRPSWTEIQARIKPPV